MAPDALKCILYTSGTTGHPKGVMLSRRVISQKITDLISLLAFSPAGRFFSLLPFFSGHGLIPGFLVPYYAGCTVVTGSFNAFLAAHFWETVARCRVTAFTSVPSLLTLIKNHADATEVRRMRGMIRDIFCASAMLPQSLCDWYYAMLGISIRNCYGLTETASWITVAPAAHPICDARSVGRPFRGEIFTVTEKKERCPANIPGELCVASTSVMDGYLKDAEQTAAVMRDGIVYTGDYGYVDGAGTVYLVSRIKNIIIRSGINIYPDEVDAVFMRHPNVRESASFGVGDDCRGEQLITALVVSEPSVPVSTYKQFAADQLPPFMQPDSIICVPALPRTGTGKIKHDELRAAYRERYS